jgi:hypothetical protein
MAELSGNFAKIMGRLRPNYLGSVAESTTRLSPVHPVHYIVIETKSVPFPSGDDFHAALYDVDSLLL